MNKFIKLALGASMASLMVWSPVTFSNQGPVTQKEVLKAKHTVGTKNETMQTTQDKKAQAKLKKAKAKAKYKIHHNNS